MNRGPLLFLGIFTALALSWFGMIVQPQLQLGSEIPGTNVVNKTDPYPQARAGLAQQGLQVYRALGCASCHSQQVRQDGTVFDVVLTASGLHDFATEYKGVREVVADGLTLPLLPLDRILVSKRAANRPKDQAQLPALEAALAVERDNERGPP